MHVEMATTTLSLQQHIGVVSSYREEKKAALRLSQKSTLKNRVKRCWTSQRKLGGKCKSLKNLLSEGFEKSRGSREELVGIDN